MSNEQEITKKDLEDDIAKYERLKTMLYKKSSKRTKEESDDILDNYKEIIGYLIARDISETKICIGRHYNREVQK